MRHFWFSGTDKHEHVGFTFGIFQEVLLKRNHTCYVANRTQPALPKILTAFTFKNMRW